MKDTPSVKGVGFLELASLRGSGLIELSKESRRQYSSGTWDPEYRHYFIYSYEMGELFHVVAESATIEHDEPS